MNETFEGRARILDPDGFLVDVGKASLEREDPESGRRWSGTLRVFVGASLANKTMEAVLELDDGRSGRALVGPRVGEIVDGELIMLKVVGLSDAAPF